MRTLFAGRVEDCRDIARHVVDRMDLRFDARVTDAAIVELNHAVATREARREAKPQRGTATEPHDQHEWLARSDGVPIDRSAVSRDVGHRYCWVTNFVTR